MVSEMQAVSLCLLTGLQIFQVILLLPSALLYLELISRQLHVMMMYGADIRYFLHRLTAVDQVAIQTYSNVLISKLLAHQQMFVRGQVLMVERVVDLIMDRADHLLQRVLVLAHILEVSESVHFGYL